MLVNAIVFLDVSCFLDELVESCLSFVDLSSALCGATVVVGTIVPGFSVNHVSPVQACPCRSRFCC